ncbi:hypothetical protein QZH41_011821 [Actinostola sp. cb2023]|nr:hypothetical protein QZH41_011821 [Actinostola sp. cb2023]
MARVGILLASVVILFNWSFEFSQAQLTTRFLRPCFEEDKERELEFCRSDPNSDCSEDAIYNRTSDHKLVRLEGFKQGHVQEVDIGEDRKYTLITKAMKPLMFVAKNEVPAQWNFATNFSIWDRNNDGKIDTKDIKHFTARHKLLFISDDDIPKMFESLEFHGYKHESEPSSPSCLTLACGRFDRMDFLTFSYHGVVQPKHIQKDHDKLILHVFTGVILKDDFKGLDIAKLMTYLDFMKNKHPKYRARFSEQAWLPQNTKSDPKLRKLHERVIKLTKLPRKIIQGGEALQVVRYGPDGHYHVHYDSMPFPDEYTAMLPCCHHNIQKPNGCRLCRFITILYYLNDVEEGGETAFMVADNDTFKHEVLRRPNVSNPDDGFNLSVNCHRANIVVAPKKGHAIMWYNHLIDHSGWLGALDEYSLHGGCDVIKGEKWIANNWLTAPPAGREDIPSVYDVGFE